MVGAYCSSIVGGGEKGVDCLEKWEVGCGGGKGCGLSGKVGGGMWGGKWC